MVLPVVGEAISGFCRSLRQLDILGEADAHEEAGEGLGEVLSVGRAKAEAFAAVGRELGEEGFGEREDSSEIDDADAQRWIDELG